MKHLKRITPFYKGHIWLKDKYKTGTNRWGTYTIALIPSFFAVLSLAADLFSFISISDATYVRLILWMLFIFGIINLTLVWTIQKYEVRLQRERSTYKILHDKIILELQDYRSEKENCKKNGHVITEDKSTACIRTILNGIRDTYMSTLHKDSVSITLKYLKQNVLHPIRIGGDEKKRQKDAEPADLSFVYKCLNDYGHPQDFIYVKNLDEPDMYEMDAMLGNWKKIRERSRDYYNTFLTLPINGPQLRLNSMNPKFSATENLGIIGFDLMAKYGFGNVSEAEIDFLSVLSSLLAEPVKDLIEN